MLDASSARWKPASQRLGRCACAASRSLVREVAIAEKIASPSAPPTCCEAFSSAAASPALSAGTPAFAAVVTRDEHRAEAERHDHHARAAGRLT